MSPRPLVVFRPVSFELQLHGTPEEAGFSLGMWTLPASIDKTSPGRLDGKILSARATAERLQQQLAHMNEAALDAPKVAAKPIPVRSVRLVEQPFATDRGRIVLPAWEFEFGDARRKPVVVPALRTGWYYESPVALIDGLAVLSEDGRTVTYNFVGGPAGTGPCESEFTPIVRESETAVAFGAIEYVPRLTGTYFCTMEGHPRQVSVTLAKPLGNRVLVTYQRGRPITVITAAQDEARRLARREASQCYEETRGAKKCLRKYTEMADLKFSDLSKAHSS